MKIASAESLGEVTVKALGLGIKFSDRWKRKNLTRDSYADALSILYLTGGRDTVPLDWKSMAAVYNYKWNKASESGVKRKKGSPLQCNDYNDYNEIEKNNISFLLDTLSSIIYSIDDLFQVQRQHMNFWR